MCRSTQIGIMGTVLTTNCTCKHGDETRQQQCTQRGDYSIRIYAWVRNVLRLFCYFFFSEMATMDFHANLQTTTAPRQRWRDTTGSKSTADRKGIHC